MAAGFAVVVAICQLPLRRRSGVSVQRSNVGTRPTGSPRDARFRFLSTRVPVVATPRRAAWTPFFGFTGRPGGAARLTRLRRDLGRRRPGRVRRIGADAELQGLQRELQLGVRLQPADVQVDEAAAGLLRHLELLDLVLLRPGAR